MNFMDSYLKELPEKKIDIRIGCAFYGHSADANPSGTQDDYIVAGLSLRPTDSMTVSANLEENCRYSALELERSESKDILDEAKDTLNIIRTLKAVFEESTEEEFEDGANESFHQALESLFELYGSLAIEVFDGYLNCSVHEDSLIAESLKMLGPMLQYR